MIRQITIQKILLLGGLSFLFGCPTPTIDPIDIEEIEKLMQQQDSGGVMEGTIDAGTESQTNTTDAGSGNEVGETDAGSENETGTIDAGNENPTNATDAGTEDETEDADAGLSCTPCEQGFTHETGTCNCIDIDECETDNGGCDINASCQNALNSGEDAICTCNIDYEGDGNSCERQCSTTASCIEPSIVMGTSSGYCSDYDVEGPECALGLANTCPNGLVCMEVGDTSQSPELRCVQPCGRKLYMRLGVATDFVCGISEGVAGLDCVGNLEETQYDDMNENYTEISCHNKTCCAVSTVPSISCFTSQDQLPAWASSDLSTFLNSIEAATTMSSLSVADNHGCLIVDGLGLCWGQADYCAYGNNCESEDNCNSTEVPCDGSIMDTFGGDQQTFIIQTSRTNTCTILNSTANDEYGTNSSNLKCVGQTGWGLGGENDIVSIEDKEAFPFLSQTDMTTYGYTFDSLNFIIESLDSVAFDEKRICVQGSFSHADNPTHSDSQVVCAGRIESASTSELNSAMLYEQYTDFKISGAWFCGIRFEGSLYCHDLTDLNNVGNGTNMFPSASTPIKYMAISENTVCINDNQNDVSCTALPGMNAQNFHLQTLGR